MLSDEVVFMRFRGGGHSGTKLCVVKMCAENNIGCIINQCYTYLY